MLLISDNDEESELFREAAKRVDEHCAFAAAGLQPGSSDAERLNFNETPHLILLNVTEWSAALDEIAANPGLRRTPVLVFSQDERARLASDSRANAFIRKPEGTHQDLLRVVTDALVFWLKVVTLPPPEPKRQSATNAT